MAKQAVDVASLQATSKIRKVNLDELQVDSSYQRAPSMSMVDKIANDWDVVASELLLVSDRGVRDDGVAGGLFIVNGQHRSLAARKKGIKGMDSRVIDLTEFEDPGEIEAEFRLRTNVRMSDKPAERYKAQLRAGNPESLAIENLLERFDTEINDIQSSEVGINAVSTVEKIYRVDDGALLKETFQIIKDIYGVVGGSNTTAPTMSGFAWFILQHGSAVERNRVIEKLSGVGHAALDRRARTIGSTMSGTLWMNYYRAIVDFYNERLQDKSKLEWKLRGASTFKGGTSGYSGTNT